MTFSAAVMFIANCNDSTDRSPWSWHAADSAATVALHDASSSCRDCINISQLVVLGDTTGQGYIERVQDVVRDSLGRYWIGQDESLKIFDVAGRYVRTVGRAGRGPMEFAYARPIFTDKRGNVHVLDTPLETVVSPHFEPVIIRRLPGNVDALAPFPDGDRYVVNMWLPTPERIGLPLHVIEGPTILHSFGGPQGPAEGPTTPFLARRVLAVDEEGHIFAANPYVYRVEVWSPVGRRVVGFDGPQLNTKEVLPGRNTLDNPPPNKILAMQTDDGGHLWVLISQRQGNWTDAVEEVVDARGRIGLREKEGTSVYETRIDVIDVTAASIVARWTGEGRFVSFAGKDIVVEDRRLRDGTPMAVVWRTVFKQ